MVKKQPTEHPTWHIGLKEIARKEQQKFPPVSESERRYLEEVWRKCEREARFGGRLIVQLPPAQPRDWINHRPDPPDETADARSRAYWTSYQKCAACPGPHRRQGKFPFGQGPNTGHAQDGEIT